MRREDISDAFNMLDEEMLAHTDSVRQQTKQIMQIRTESGRKWLSMAAGLCLICLAAIAIVTVSWRNPSGDLSYHGGFADSLRLEGTIEDRWNAENPENAQDTQEPFVAVADLLASSVSNSGMIKQMAAEYGKVPVGQYTGIYEKVYDIDSAVLADSIGSKVDGAGDWYYISGHEDLQYLICEKDRDYSLWKFGYFDSEEYPYSDVLQMVYKIMSADKITDIKVEPAKMDNTDEGKRIQEEIGTRLITNRDKINQLYQTLCTMTCYGNNRWDLIDYGDAEVAADIGLPDHAAVRMGRYLTLTMDNGNEIDGLKYTAVSGMFYEFSGVAYNRLGKEQAESVNEILGIL
ncbi:MAG: hypothetical protein NC094_13685 [Bacteroidales bacterium]|nr:hypothetical protein [Lachnoclostridium sp.]MCM1385597.1 hypothetical protein [Lachnoclostridium sp.]MCM1466452.1 hypothetical protein [Bacteroidales bacterium]